MPYIIYIQMKAYLIQHRELLLPDDAIEVSSLLIATPILQALEAHCRKTDMLWVKDNFVYGLMPINNSADVVYNPNCYYRVQIEAV